MHAAGQGGDDVAGVLGADLDVGDVRAGKPGANAVSTPVQAISL
jgi:hypothetical protein